MTAPPALPLPLTVVGGFLGAGKTTLVNHVLEQAHGRRLAILVNDFGALSIDAALVSSRSVRTMSLANGCVCCTLVNGLAQALLDVLSLDPLPDQVLVEASGVADPGRIAQIARADRSFAQDATLVLAAADQIRALAADRYVGDTVLRQLAAADLIVLNKIDLVSEADARTATAWLNDVAPQARIVPATQGALPCEAVLGTPASLTRTGDSVSTPHGYCRTDHAALFTTRTLQSVRPLHEASLRGALDALPASVLRAKGFVRFAADPTRVQLVQLVGRRWSIAPAPPHATVDRSTLVIVAATPSLHDDELGDLPLLFAA